jgi:DNA-binding MarR family transcriptional regulator
VQRGKDREKRLRKAESPSATAGHAPWPLPQRPGFLIRRLHQIHVALFQESCGAFDITPLQYSLLSALAVRGTADQTTLAADIALDRTTTTGALKRLAARKLVQRVVDRGDRRARVCRLTTSGAALLSRIEGAAREAHRATLGHLSKSEQTVFIALMQRIIADHANHGSTADMLDEPMQPPRRKMIRK